MRKLTRSDAGPAIVVLLAIVNAAVPAAGQSYRDRAVQAGSGGASGSPIQQTARVQQKTSADRRGRGESNAVASSGQRLVSEAAQRVFSLSSLHARLRIKYTSQGRSMAAAGEYTQLGVGTDKLLRLDLKFPVGSKIGTMQEIRTRDYLWLIRDLPPDPPSLERVDLTWTRKNIARAQDDGRLGPLDGWMLLGGLSRLMTSLEGNFEFGDPKPATLADVPVVLLRGRWKQSAFDPTIKLSSPDNLPASLPREVEVTLGDPGGRLPLFPYRIEFLRGEPGQEQGRAGGNDMSLATIEFFEVHPSASINPQQFEYDPEDRDVDDVTIPYLRKLGLGPAKSP